jgi:hypothetical protein
LHCTADGETGRGIQGDSAVEGEVAPTPKLHLLGEEDERGRLAGASAGLDGEMAAAFERLQGGSLFVGRGKGHGTDLSGSSKARATDTRAQAKGHTVGRCRSEKCQRTRA